MKITMILISCKNGNVFSAIRCVTLYSILWLALPFYAKSQNVALHIFAGSNHTVYLGCVNCSRTDPNSIWNPYGDYGGRYGSKSFWNRYSNYSMKYNTESFRNEYSTSDALPIVVDSNRNFYGYFTANKYKSKRCNLPLLDYIIENYETICSDPEAAYRRLFE